MTILKTGDWGKVSKVLTDAPAKLQSAMDKALLQEGQFFRGKIVEGLREQAPGGQAFKPLSPLTIAARQLKGFGGSKALIRRGDLRNGVTVKKIGEKVFVGVLRNAMGKNGQPVGNIAEINEFGGRPIIIKITPAMQRFLGVLYEKAGIARPKSGTAGTGVVVIRIPPRPFIGPVWKKWGTPPEQVARRFAARVAKLMGGDIGTLGGTFVSEATST